MSINSNTYSSNETYQCMAKVREQIIRSERIPHFNVISFEEDQLNSSSETPKSFFLLNFQCPASAKTSDTLKQTNNSGY